MTSEEFLLLRSDLLREVIEANRGRNPLDVALDKRVPYASLVATQLKYLSRAEQKLPDFARVGAIIPPRAFEQSSSQLTAEHKTLSGESVLELTCGLGVDTMALARRFREVVTLERDQLLAEITRENLRRLGIENVEVVNSSAEEYVASCGRRFDWIYADPDRRSSEGKKMVRLEDCSPDILSMRSSLESIADKICLKLSPLFDVDEAFRLFPRSRVEVVSLSGECKEVVIYADNREPEIVASAIGLGEVAVRRSEVDSTYIGREFAAKEYGYLLMPDVSLQKARLVCHTLKGRAYVSSENGFGFACEPIEGFLGRTFEIESIEPYNPKRLKCEYRGEGVEIFKRDTTLSLDKIRKSCGLKDGNKRRLAFTEIEGRVLVIRLKNRV